MDDLLASVRVALAETWCLYFKAHSFHWNVQGPLFPQLHELFGDIYEDAHDAVDGLAERLRTLNAMAPASLAEISAPASIAFGGIPTTAGMIFELIDATAAVVNALGRADQLASIQLERGLSNYLQERMDAHKKWAWMLTATIAEDTAQ
ncbi:DNA starvation/stationary phase protection protein [Rhizobium sp. SGZ-381]|uniref:Dps family protein n=1 Tax=Rhizobium sp. SGZ-381 TaxID=3342800 RepID=UPI00366A55FF